MRLLVNKSTAHSQGQGQQHGKYNHQVPYFGYSRMAPNKAPPMHIGSRV